MGELTKRLIHTLHDRGDMARACLQDVGELLRKAWQPGFVPFAKALQAEEATDAEIEELRDALATYCRSEPDASARRTALTILAKERRPELRGELLQELQDVVKAHRILSRELFQLLLALEDVGEAVFSPEVHPRSLAAVEGNVNTASEYLRKQGIEIPWQ